MKITLFWRKMLLTLLSIILLSLGWLGSTGLTLLVALVPLLWISSEAEDNPRGWWSTFGWALLTFVGWNLSTIWWIGFSTPIGPVAATVASSFQSMLAFMIFHTISKRAPKALAYTALVSIWIALEYNYTVSEFSWPWLLLGNGFSNNVWAIQWYEFTGIFGGSLWVLISNILIFEAYRNRISSKVAVTITLLPLIVSIIMFFTYNEEDSAEKVEITVIQPNVDCYKKFSGSMVEQEKNLLELLRTVPSTTDIILMPETAIPRYCSVESVPYVHLSLTMRDTLRCTAPNATILSGAKTMLSYIEGEQTKTARSARGRYYDSFNSAITLDVNLKSEIRHKTKLVIGVENTPTWIFKVFNFFVIDLGGVVGQLGKGDAIPKAFTTPKTKVGGAICYEGLYGDFYGGFVRDGAEVMSIISNDGWWRDTPGHRHLYSFSSIRAIEHRRAIARSANTGTSGFINAKGVSIESLGWDQRGVITQQLSLNNKLTLYTRWGDYIARIAVFVAVLSLLYYLSYRVRKRLLLVK
ncbi:MAG: apolipoprotein N-acyltransferase [Rikenellaceae bacterium]